jgi:hypothetical protein
LSVILRTTERLLYRIFNSKTNNNNKTKNSLSVILRPTERLLTLKLFLSCYCCLFCYWKYGKATVQLSSIWLSNCSCLVIVVCFVIENTVKQPNNKTRTVWVSYWRHLNGCFTVFSIEKQNNNKTKTVWVSYKQPLSCLQYDTQTVLVLLLLFVLLLKIR